MKSILIRHFNHVIDRDSSSSSSSSSSWVLSSFTSLTPSIGSGGFITHLPPFGIDYGHPINFFPLFTPEISFWGWRSSISTTASYSSKPNKNFNNNFEKKKKKKEKKDSCHIVKESQKCNINSCPASPFLPPNSSSFIHRIIMVN